MVVVKEVFAGSNAEAQGIHAGDILLTYAEWNYFPERDESPGQLDSSIEAVKEKQKTVMVWRDGKLLKFDFGPGLIGTRIEYVQKPRKLLEQIGLTLNKDTKKSL